MNFFSNKLSDTKHIFKIRNYRTFVIICMGFMVPTNVFSVFLEHFCDPDDKKHPKFNRVADTEMSLYSANNQEPILNIPLSVAISKLWEAR